MDAWKCKRVAKFRLMAVNVV